MNPKVSVIVPVYNVEEYLGRCVRSLLEQTYTNVEILLIDDGSTDSCPSLCDAFASADRRVRVLHKENGGLSDARNAGTALSTGEYVCFVDSDDFVSPRFVEALLEICVTRECEIAVCGFAVTASGEAREDGAPLRVRLYTNVEFLREFYTGSHTKAVVAWNKMYRRDVVQRASFPYGLYHEDEATTCQYIYAANRVGVCENALYYYFQRADSIVNRKASRKRLEDKLKALRIRMEFYREKNLLELLPMEELLYLKAISRNYREAASLPEKSAYRRELARRFRRAFRRADRAAWNVKNRLLMALCLLDTGFYARMKAVKNRCEGGLWSGTS